jgi:hypothetical protein
MQVGIIGGLDRSAPHYRALEREYGHSIACHRGAVAGAGSANLETLVQRSDLVVIVTDVNSHAGVWTAQRLARRHGRPVVFVRHLGISRLRQILSSLGTGTPTAAAAPT